MILTALLVPRVLKTPPGTTDSDEAFRLGCEQHVTAPCDRQPSPLVEFGHSRGGLYLMSVSDLPHLCNGRHTSFVI